MWAHPRSRGENQAVLGLREPTAGSSPLTRGKLIEFCHEGRGDGLIPAHAGKTLGCRRGSGASRAHPRSRGENDAGGHAAAVGPGLIPAHAGKTRSSGFVCVCKRAHPRSRGENLNPARFGKVLAGSSPLTRGKRCVRA